MNHKIFYAACACGIIGMYLLLGIASCLDSRPREAVIAFLFAASNAAIFVVW